MFDRDLPGLPENAISTKTLLLCGLGNHSLFKDVMRFQVPGKLSLEPSDLSGSQATILEPFWPQRRHSNVRRSKPSVPGETSTVFIRIWHFGQCGHEAGNSSGSGFAMVRAVRAGLPIP
jgi:hypothetical protein